MASFYPDCSYIVKTLKEQAIDNPLSKPLALRTIGICKYIWTPAAGVGHLTTRRKTLLTGVTLEDFAAYVKYCREKDM